MFSGIQEIIVLLIIVLFIFLIPNFFRKRNSLVRLKSYPKIHIKLKYRIRLFILGSIIWLSFFTILIKPWEKERFLNYIILAICPIALFWGIRWVNAGDK